MTALQDKAIVITGAGRGIGAACAREAASQGAAVVVNDLDADLAARVVHDIRAAGGRASAHGGNVADWHGAATLIQHCVDTFGGIDGLVNNAGIFRMAHIDTLDEADLRDILQVNVLGPAFCTRHAVPFMRQRGGGAIVNVTSGAQMGIAAMSAYCASKGAVASFTYACAIDLRDSNIRVNALSPRAATRMTETAREFERVHGRPRPPAVGAPSVEGNAMVTCYLLSDAARGMTGQVVRVDGDKLSIVTHPAVLGPVIPCQEWTRDVVFRAFESDLLHRQQPLGVVVR